MPRIADVVVVGGSVAGAATAAFLAQRGLAVTLVERARFPRDKPCGEGLMPHGVEVLAALGVLDEVLAGDPRVLRGVRYTIVDGATTAAAFQNAQGEPRTGFGIRRFTLDRILLDHALRQSDVQFGACFQVRGLLWRRGVAVGVTDGKQEIAARVVVGADGLRSRVRGLMGWDASPGWPRRYAVVGHWQLPLGKDAPDEIEVVLASDLEAYVTPLAGGECLVALLGGRKLMRRFAGDLCGSYAARVMAQPRLRRVLDGATLQPGVRATGPFAARARCVAGRGALLVGDAAGFLDPITGEGMAAALLQAQAAALTIVDALASGEQNPDLRAYVTRHRRITGNGNLLTWIALALCASPLLTRRALSGLQRRPGLFGRLLAINSGYAGLDALTPRDWLALLAGR